MLRVTGTRRVGRRRHPLEQSGSGIDGNTVLPRQRHQQDGQVAPPKAGLVQARHLLQLVMDQR